MNNLIGRYDKLSIAEFDHLFELLAPYWVRHSVEMYRVHKGTIDQVLWDHFLLYAKRYKQFISSDNETIEMAITGFANAYEEFLHS